MKKISKKEAKQAKGAKTETKTTVGFLSEVADRAANSLVIGVDLEIEPARLRYGPESCRKW